MTGWSDTRPGRAALVVVLVLASTLPLARVLEVEGSALQVNNSAGIEYVPLSELLS